MDTNVIELQEAHHVEMMAALRHLYRQISEMRTEIADIQSHAVPAANSPGGYGAFPATSLNASVAEGKVYWKIKGGDFQKFGVTVWPEVLVAAGIGPDELDPLQPLDLVGWTATYSTKENGQPKKIIRITRPAIN